MDYEAKERLNEKLDNCITLAKIFELVKGAVKRFLNMHRAGLMLGLADLRMKRGYFIGAFHPVGSNIIVVNRTPLRPLSEPRREESSTLTASTCFSTSIFTLLDTLMKMR